jgi:hypothetical protein
MKKLLIFCAVIGFVFVFGNTAIASKWKVPGDFLTIQNAIDDGNVLDGDTIFVVGPGNFAGATVTKAVEIKGKSGAVINGGPPLGPYTTGFLFPWSTHGVANGAIISHLSFEDLDLPIYSRYTDDVTIDHCTFTSPFQGITNWNGNGWDISHNVINGLITRNGGGIGIFVGTRDAEASTANNNLIAHNKITGMVVVPQYEIDEYEAQGEDAGYSVPGITLMSDRRYGKAAGTISGNLILKNKIAITSNHPRNHAAVGIGLSDLGLNLAVPVADLLENKVGFNDVRGMLEEGTPISLYPDSDVIDDNNIISRNRGDDIPNRGHGVHPKVLFEE